MYNIEQSCIEIRSYKAIIREKIFKTELNSLEFLRLFRISLREQAKQAQESGKFPRKTQSQNQKRKIANDEIKWMFPWIDTKG